MKRLLLLLAVVVCSSWGVFGCSDNGETREPSVTSGVVTLPDGSPAGMSDIQVVTTFSASVPKADGSYSAKVAEDQGHLVMAVAEDANRDVRLLLIRVARPNIDGGLDAESTARALVMLAPFIVHHEANILGEIEDVIASLPEVTALAGAIENGLSSGKYLDEISSDQGMQTQYSDAVRAAITALKAAANSTRRGSLSQSRFALKIDPEDEVSGIQLVPDDVDDKFVTVNNRGRRWLSVYAGAPGSDELLAIAESPPSILSLESIFQATVLTTSEVSVDLSSFSGIVDTRIYGPGLGATQPQCGRPAYTDVRILIPTIATVLDNFVSPLLNIISGLDLTTLDIYQDFLVSVAIGVWTNMQCLEEVLDLDGEVDWSSLAWCILEETSKSLLETAMKVVLKSGDLWVGHGKKGPRFDTFTNAMAKVLSSGGDVGSLEMLSLDDSFIVKLLSSAGLGVLQIAAKSAVLPIRVISMAASAFELGGAVGTILASSPAECFSVDMEDGAQCVDNDQDGYGVGVDCLGPDCDDSDPAIHSGCAGCVDADGDGHDAFDAVECPGGDDHCDDNPSNWTTTGCASCVDADGDGYGENCDLGPDCDDENAAVYTGCSTATFMLLAANGYHACGQTNDGVAYCWGSDRYGQLGNGVGSPGTCAFTDPCSVLPVQVDTTSIVGSTVFVQLAAGDHHTCGITSEGVAYCWGEGGWGVLGDGNTSAISEVPVPVDTSNITGSTTFVQVVGGGQHTCGLTSDGAAYCWGNDIRGQLGEGVGSPEYMGSSGYSSIPVPVDTTSILGEKTFVQLSVGQFHSCGIMSDGDAYCWGRDDFGQLGDGNTPLDICFSHPCAQLPIPVDTSLITGDKFFVQLSTGGYLHTCGIMRDGAAYCWGADSDGQLGDGGTSVDSIVPVPVDTANVVGQKDFAQIAVGGSHSCGITTEGVAYCWGDNNEGQLGDANRPSDSQIPILVDTSSIVGEELLTNISLGGWHTCAIAVGGAVYCWGNDSMGQLGNDEPRVDSVVPTAVDTSSL